MDDATDPPVTHAPDAMDVSPAAIPQRPLHRTVDTDPANDPALRPTPLKPPPVAAPSHDPTRDTKFTYVLRSYSTIQEQRVYSPYHNFAGFKWRLLIFPRGNQSSNHDLSVYLECGGPVQRTGDASAPNGRDPISSSLSPYPWQRPAKFWLILVHPSSPIARAELPSNPVSTAEQNPDISSSDPEPLANNSAAAHTPARNEIVKEAQHNFRETASDWGFLEFASFSILKPSQYADTDMNVVILVRIHLQDSAPDPLLANTVPLDSRKETGFVGFKNQGATCYMNSLLQTLYMVSAFRKAVYNMPLPEPANENSRSELSYALQKVFYELQNSPTVVKTKKLTESFGWDTTDAFTQHDVQELKLILCDELAERMKKITPNKPNSLSTLFQGKLLNYVECINVDFTSTTEEEFSDLSLNVKGCRNIYESFEKYMEVEVMEGDNKYRADGFDELQDARKGVKFLKLPPVLQLHLKRFEYDLTRYAMVKINDRYEFESEINLSPFVEKSDGTDVYVLHSVLVHIGDVNGGHYHAFIRPTIDISGDEPKKPVQWFKFDDETVTAATREQAVQDNFGVGGDRDISKRRQGLDDDLSGVNGAQNPPSNVYSQARRTNYQTRRCSNAYMLQYLRKSDVPLLLKLPQESDVPEALAAKIEKEREEEARRQKEKAEQHLYMNIAVATDLIMAAHDSSDLVSWDKAHVMRVRRNAHLSELKHRLQKEGLIQDANRVRIWRCVTREDDTTRPESLVAQGFDTQEIADPNSRDQFINAAYNYPLYSGRHGYYGQEDAVHMYAEDLSSVFCLGSGQAYNAYLRNLQETSDDVKAESFSPMAITDGKTTSIMETDILRPKVPIVPAFPLAYGKEVLLFLKFYTPTPRPRLQWLGHFVVDGNTVLRDLYPLFKRALHQVSSRDPTLPKLPENAELDVYAEETAHRISELIPEISLVSQRVPFDATTGDIIVFQQSLGAENGAAEQYLWDGHQNPRLGDGTDLPLGGRPLPTINSFFQYLACRVKIEFKDKATVGTADEVKSIFFELLRRDTYQTARKVLAGALGDDVDPDYLRFFAHSRDLPANDSLRLADDDSLDRVLPMHPLLTPGHTEHRIIWYERTEYHISEFDNNYEVRVTWRLDGGSRISSNSSSPNNSSAASGFKEKASTNITSGDGSTKSDGRMNQDDQKSSVSTSVEDKKSPMVCVPDSQVNIEVSKTFSVLVPLMSKYSKVMEEVREKLGVPSIMRTRLLEIKSSRIVKIINPDDPLPSIMTAHECSAELRAEPVPPEEVHEALGDEYILMPVLHLAKEKQPRVWRGLTFFGNPFVIRLKSGGEAVREIRKRIQDKLGIASSEFDEWPLTECVQANVVYLKEDDIYKPQERPPNEFCSLAIEHKGSAPARRTQLNRYADKPLKIRS